MRWLDQGNRSLADRVERRLEQPDFADAGLLHQQLNERANGPSTSRQLGGECRIACIDRFPDAASELRPSPQGGVDCFGVDWSD